MDEDEEVMEDEDEKGVEEKDDDEEVMEDENEEVVEEKDEEVM